MKIRVLNFGKLAFYAANFYLVLSLLFFNGNIFETLFVFFSETFIFLILSIIKIFFLEISLKLKIKNALTYSLGLLIFICFEAAVILLFYIKELETQNPDAELFELIKLIFNFSYFIGLLFFTASHLYYFVYDFLKKEKYLEQNVMQVIKMPFVRLWILLITVFIGIATFKYANSIFVVILFIALRAWLDNPYRKQKIK